MADLKPNVGLHWYLTAEAFDRFQSYFRWAFGGHVFVYAPALTIQFGNQSPLLCAGVMLGVAAIFKPYPTMGGAAFAACYLACFPLATQRQHELHVRIRPPSPLMPLLPVEPPVDAPAECHARAHTELEGGVVQWGDKNVVASVADCCAACTAHAKKDAALPNPGARGCNVRSMWMPLASG